MKLSLRFVVSAFAALLGASGTLIAQEDDQITVADLSSAVAEFHDHGSANRHKAPNVFGPGVTGIDSLVNFTSSFTVAGLDPNGKPQSVWPFSMVGNDPAKGRTTMIQSAIIPVSVLLLNYDGTPRYVNGQLLFADATQFVNPLLKSPVYDSHRYTSSENPTQFVDAVQKAGYGREADDDWHTLLAPSVKTPRLMTLLRGTYRYALNKDGSCCLYILAEENNFGNLLFPPNAPDGTTVIGAAELAGDMTTKEITTLLFNNVYLYSVNPDGTTSCCVLGYHAYDYEAPATPTGYPQAFVMNYSSWITAGIFKGGFADVTAASHEMAEIFADPFVNNWTPWWLSPSGGCQDNLEVGDVVEGLSNATYPITMNGYTYHPQNVGLLPWFEFQSPSKAFQHAYSYPDETLLTSAPAPQKLNCAN